MKLAELRQVRGWSQEELARRSGVTLRVVGEVEREERLLDRQLGTFCRLADALGVAVTAVLPALDVAPGTPREPRLTGGLR